MRPLRVSAALAAALLAAGAAHAQSPGPADPISLLDQTDGVNSKRVATVAIFCRATPCAGRLKLAIGALKVGAAPFSILAKTTGKVPVKLTKAGFALVKGAKKRTMKATVTVTMASGQTFTHVITLKA